ncbi:MAG: methionine adenosyltransferase domain-containing protein [Fimbriimonadaceae bacterium]|nr:methionine adenosyltransferase domain-containing protein [Fimbriimonadaceae bacterium]
MIRVSEAVLPGHPDKLCDRIADEIVAEAYRADDRACVQVEMACWRNEFTLTGHVVARRPVRTLLADIVRRVANEVGFCGENAVQADRFDVRCAVGVVRDDPREWTDRVNDQSIVVGYAGYDARTRWLPPEHFLALALSEALADSCRNGALQGQGPDGKLLVRVRESGNEWALEHLLVSLQHLDHTPLAELCGLVVRVLRDAYEAIRRGDPRWVLPFDDVGLMVNPNGPFLKGGPLADNGQTGRKLVVDQYGPRVPIGGGALSGKDLSNIDRAGAYAARAAAVATVAGGATECRVRVCYAPNVSRPLDVGWDLVGRGPRFDDAWFDHRSVVACFPAACFDPRVASRGHYHDLDLPWNRPTREDP